MPIARDAVRVRIVSGQQRDVRRQGFGNRSERALKENTVFREPIDVRRRDPRMPVASEPVRALRIDRDDDDVRGSGRRIERRGRDNRFLSAAGHRQQPKRGDSAWKAFRENQNSETSGDKDPLVVSISHRRDLLSECT